jgi:recombinational DNA repair protein (RecF pathway)
MAYTIHQTSAYILKSSPHLEANRRIDLLTKDLGLIRGTAQGIRLLKSKLRYTLTDFSRVDVSLVRGKDTWRIVNASKSKDLYYELTPEIRQIFLKLFSLVDRLIKGEMIDPHIYDLIREAEIYSSDNHDLTKEELNGMEIFLVFRLLNLLGYVGQGELLSKFQHIELSRNVLKDVLNSKKEIITVVNYALRESGL